jgi:large subunit ribosomal protein L4
MATLKKYDLTGSEVGKVEIADNLLETKANNQMIKDYIVALRANARQWSANTKTRAEVCHSGKKPHPQKGTGRARQGYLGAPQYKGGGRVHAPRPKFDQHVRINRKEKRAAIRTLLAEKILQNNLHILQLDKMDAPKTKRLADFLKTRELAGKRILFLGEGVVAAEKLAKKKGAKKSEEQSAQVKMLPGEKYGNFHKSIRNIPKVEFLLLPNASGYDIAVSREIVVLEPAVDELMLFMGGK